MLLHLKIVCNSQWQLGWLEVFLSCDLRLVDLILCVIWGRFWRPYYADHCSADCWENLMGGSWSCPQPRATLSCVFYLLSSVFNLLLYSERAILKNAIIARVFYASISFTFWARTCSLTTTWLLASHKLATFAASLFHPWWLHLDGQHNHLRLCNSWLLKTSLPSGTAFQNNHPWLPFPHLPLIRWSCLVRHLARWAGTTFSATHQGWPDNFHQNIGQTPFF